MRRRSRRGGSRGGFIAGLNLSSIKGLFSKDNLLVAAGVVGATSVTVKAFDMFRKDGEPQGKSLPGLYAADGTPNKAAQVAYSILIPGLVGILVRRFSRPVSDGLIFGGLANGVRVAVSNYVTDAGTRAAWGFQEYLGARRTPVRGLSAPIGTPGYSGVRAFGNVLGSQSPFKASNW